jgi:hypothetical protein
MLAIALTGCIVSHSARSVVPLTACRSDEERLAVATNLAAASFLDHLQQHLREVLPAGSLRPIRSLSLQARQVLSASGRGDVYMEISVRYERGEAEAREVIGEAEALVKAEVQRRCGAAARPVALE